MQDWLLQITGCILVLVAVLDLFLTVLYARNDVGLLSPQVSHLVWSCFRGTAKTLPAGGQRLLTFAGPVLLAAIVLLWLSLLVVGFALIIWPVLGDEIRKTSGETPVDFATAVYYSGYTLATLGYGDIAPQSAFWRVLAVVESLLGFSVLTLSLTYLVSVYSALVRRNVLALALHHRSGRTDDAAELLARLGVGGRLDRVAAQSLADLNLRLHDLYESHHSYPILHYFHFVEPHYAMAHVMAMLADVAALARTALDSDQHAQFARSAEVEEALTASTDSLQRLSALFLPKSYRPEGSGSEAAEELEAWRGRFNRAVERLSEARVTTTANPEAAADQYVQLRRGWAPYATAFRQYMLTNSGSDAGLAG